MSTCKTCSHWTRDEDDYSNYSNPETFRLMGSCAKSDHEGGKDFFGATGGGNYDSFHCGEDFGCINHTQI